MQNLLVKIAHADIMTSSVPGLILQIEGFGGSKKVHHESLFVDNILDYTFVHHQTSTSSEEKIKSKHACEACLRKFGKEVRHYYAYNGTYAVAKYLEEINSSKQILAFCGVSSHH